MINDEGMTKLEVRISGRSLAHLFSLVGNFVENFVGLTTVTRAFPQCRHIPGLSSDAHLVLSLSLSLSPLNGGMCTTKLRLKPTRQGSGIVRGCERRGRFEATG